MLEGLKVNKMTKPLYNINVIFEVIFDFMKNLRVHDISIRTNLYQNRSINECTR